MADFDVAWDVEIEIENFILNKFEELYSFEGNEYNYRGIIQCLELFINKIYKCDSYLNSDELISFLRKLSIDLNSISFHLNNDLKLKLNKLNKFLNKIDE